MQALEARACGERGIWVPHGEVELRLSRHFYDLAALAPQDAEAYVRMREQALSFINELYNLIMFRSYSAYNVLYVLSCGAHWNCIQRKILRMTQFKGR